MKIGEHIEFGMFDSRVVFPNLKITAKRLAKYFELEYVVDCDKDATSYIDDKSFRLSPHTVLIRKPGQHCNTRLHFKAYYIHLHIEKENPLFDEFSALLSYYPFINDATYQTVFEAFLHHNARNHENVHDHFSTAKILELLYYLQKDTPRNKQFGRLYPNANNRFLQDAISHMKTHYDEKITLEALGELTGYTPNHFRTVFTALMGVSPQKYLEELRLTQAKYLLLSTNEPLAEIAYECGFSSQAYFTQVFKRATLLTPNEFRATAVAEYQP